MNENTSKLNMDDMEKVAGGGGKFEEGFTKDQQLDHFYKYIKDRRYVMSAEGALRDAIRLNEQYVNTLVTTEDLEKLTAEIYAN